MRIAGIQKSSTVDFPGRLCAVLFTAGCDLHCFYCHNRHILDDPPLLDPAAVLSFLEQRRGWLDGVVFSGGEPTLQPDLADWLERVRAMGFAVKLDTNGRHPAVLEALLRRGLADYVAMDWKAPPERYPELCGGPANGVLQSIRLLETSGTPHEYRTTLIPQLDRQTLLTMGAYLPREAVWALQLYRPQPGDQAALGEAVPYTPEQVRELAKDLRSAHPGVLARC